MEIISAVKAVFKVESAVLKLQVYDPVADFHWGQQWRSMFLSGSVQALALLCLSITDYCTIFISPSGCCLRFSSKPCLAVNQMISSCLSHSILLGWLGLRYLFILLLIYIKLLWPLFSSKILSKSASWLAGLGSLQRMPEPKVSLFRSLPLLYMG